MTKLKIADPKKTNDMLIQLIKNVKINKFYLNNQKDFRDKILNEIKDTDQVLDIGKGMREKLIRFDAII